MASLVPTKPCVVPHVRSCFLCFCFSCAAEVAWDANRLPARTMRTGKQGGVFAKYLASKHPLILLIVLFLKVDGLLGRRSLFSASLIYFGGTLPRPCSGVSSTHLPRFFIVSDNSPLKSLKPKKPKVKPAPYCNSYTSWVLYPIEIKNQTKTSGSKTSSSDVDLSAEELSVVRHVRLLLQALNDD